MSKIRIVKLLYLIDLEYYRHCRRTLTGLEWFYHHYGPYAVDIETSLTRRRIHLGEETFVTKKGFEGTTYRTYGDPPDLREAGIPYAAEVYINRVIKRWALEELPALLAFVYSETSPMVSAVKGECLDFSGEPTAEEMFREPEYLELPARIVDRIRAKIAAQRARPSSLPKPSYDAEYQDAIRRLREDERPVQIPFGSTIVATPGRSCRGGSSGTQECSGDSRF